MPLIRIENYPPGCDLDALVTRLRGACVAAIVPGIDSVELVTVVAGSEQLIAEDKTLVIIVDCLFARPDRTKGILDWLALTLARCAKGFMLPDWKVEVFVKRFDPAADSFCEIPPSVELVDSLSLTRRPAVAIRARIRQRGDSTDAEVIKSTPRLIVVRHGHYDDCDLKLNGLGRHVMRLLAIRLAPYLQGTKVVLASSAPRAVESAEILVSTLGLAGFEQHEVLRSEKSRRPQNEPVLALVRKAFEQADTVILVTHGEYAEGFPAYFAKEVLGVSVWPGMIEPGEAFVVFCDEKRGFKVAHSEPRND